MEHAQPSTGTRPSRARSYMSFRRLGGLFLLLGGWAWFALCSAPGCHIWFSPPDQQSCDPLKYPVLSTPWTQAMQRTPRLTGCLQVAWGANLEKGEGILVQIDDLGQLYGREGTTDRFSSKQPILLPSYISGEERRFRLFVLAPSFGREQPFEEIEQFCHTEMSVPAYDCLAAKEEATCWFYFAFRPESNFGATTPTIQDDMNQSCRIFARSVIQEQVPEEKIVEESVSPEEKTREEPILEEMIAEDAGPEPLPEPQPEPNCESDPDIGQSCILSDKLGGCRDGKWACVAGQKTCKALLSPSPEICDRLDNNCNGQVDEGFFQVVTSVGKSLRSFQSVAIGPQGDIYVAGNFSGDFSLGQWNLSSQGGSDIVVARLSSDGKPKWVVRGGGAQSDEVSHITVDAKGYVYIMGSFTGATVLGNTTLRTSANRGWFLAQLDGQGSFTWAQTHAGTAILNPKALHTDASGQVYVVGDLAGQTATFGKMVLNSPGGNNGFFVRFDAQGQATLAKLFGGESYIYVRDAAFDGSNFYVVGRFNSSASFDSFQLTSLGREDLFLVRMTMDADVMWAIRAGTETSDDIESAVFVQQGELVVTGRFVQSMKLGKLSLSHAGQALYLAGLDPSNGDFRWAVALGDGNYIQPKRLGSDRAGDIYVLGEFGSSLNVGGSKLQSAIEVSGFLARFDRAKQTWLWGISPKSASSNPSDSDFTFARSLAVEPLGHSYFAGGFLGDFIFGSVQAQSNVRVEAAFLAKVTASGEWSCP